MISARLFTTLFACMALMHSCANDQTKKDTGWASWGLKEKVKSLKITYYKAIEKFGKIEKGSQTDGFSFGNNDIPENALVLFNEKGNKVEENRYKADGSLKGKGTYKFDDQGNKVEGNWYKADGSLDHKLTYKYDDQVNPVEENYYKADGSIDEKVTYKYDDQGNPVEENFYKEDGGSLGYKLTYKHTYDKRGNLKESILFENKVPQKIMEREIVYF